MVSDDVAWLAGQGQQWRGLKSVAMVEAVREFVSGKRRSEVTVERRYYISSVEADAARLAGLVRSHWDIENRLHWVLDVTFGEDDSRARIGHAAENFGFLRRMAINLLQRAPGGKREGPTVKRRHAMWNLDYLKVVLGLATS